MIRRITENASGEIFEVTNLIDDFASETEALHRARMIVIQLKNGQGFATADIQSQPVHTVQ